MATRAILTPFAAEFPASNFPQLLLSNRQPVLAFDGATDETCQWTLKAPQGLTGTQTLVLTCAAATATTGACGFQADVEAITPGDAVDTDTADSFDTVNNSASTSVPATAGYLFEISITLTNVDSMAAGDRVRIRLRRDADGSAITDNITSDIYVFNAEWRDSA